MNTLTRLKPSRVRLLGGSKLRLISKRWNVLKVITSILASNWTPRCVKLGNSKTSWHD